MHVRQAARQSGAVGHDIQLGWLSVAWQLTTPFLDLASWVQTHTHTHTHRGGGGPSIKRGRGSAASELVAALASAAPLLMTPLADASRRRRDKPGLLEPTLAAGSGAHNGVRSAQQGKGRLHHSGEVSPTMLRALSANHHMTIQSHPCLCKCGKRWWAAVWQRCGSMRCMWCGSTLYLLM